MTDFSEWVIDLTDPRDLEESPDWRLWHLPCGWTSNPQGPSDRRSVAALHDWIGAHQCPEPVEHPLTWGQVPAGWEVRAPDGKWYRITRTRRPFGTTGNVQIVTILGKEWSRDPAAPVTARGYDPAIEALGFPEVLEDGS